MDENHRGPALSGREIAAPISKPVQQENAFGFVRLLSKISVRLLTHETAIVQEIRTPGRPNNGSLRKFEG
jgi:hypothetical protein